MSVVDTVRVNLASQIAAAIAGLNAYAYWPDSFHAPGVILIPALLDASDQTMGNNTLSEHGFELLLAVSLAPSLVIPQQQLAVYTDAAGSGSIVRAIKADRKLSGAAISIFLDNWSREDIEPINGIEHLGQRLGFRVWTT